MSKSNFVPLMLKVYHNKGGGDFKCIGTGVSNRGSYGYRMQNIKSGWTFLAHGIVQYENGDIEWDFSTGGEFLPIEN